ncbi:unnamed protein product [Urochloa humidicola]
MDDKFCFMLWMFVQPCCLKSRSKHFLDHLIKVIDAQDGMLVVGALILYVSFLTFMLCMHPGQMHEEPAV